MWVVLALVLLTAMFLLPVIQISMRQRVMKSEMEQRGGAVSTKDAVPSWLADVVQAVGLPVPQRVYAVRVPRDFSEDDWQLVDGFPHLYYVSLEDASFKFHPDQLPKSVDMLVLGSVEADPEDLRAARPDLTFR